MPQTRAEPPLHAGALLDREQVAEHRQHDRPDRPRPKPLDHPHRDQLGHAPRQARQHRAQREERQTEQEHTFAAQQIGQLAIDRGGDRRRQQVGREDPGVDIEPLQAPR